MAHQCSICGKQVPPRPDNKSYPFCGNRCRMVDLGNWFSGNYSLSRPIDPEKDAEALADLITESQEDVH